MGLVRRVVALFVVLVSVPAALVALTLGRHSTKVTPPHSTVNREVARAPTPPRGSVVFARELGEFAVALAVRPGRPLRLTATILGQSGNGVDGLEVALIAAGASRGDSELGRPCGHGCYAASVADAAPERFAVDIAGVGSAAFAAPSTWPPPPGGAFLRRATRAFDSLRTVVFTERLASSPSQAIVTTWKLAAPDRYEYEIRGGAAGIAIGAARWDRAAPGAPWQRSQTIAQRQPFVPWGSSVANVRVLRETPRHVTLSWLNPDGPAWFTTTFDRRTALPSDLRMTAAAHFMHHVYGPFDAPFRIRPPRPG
jgi:hypothetical protein